MSQRPSEILTTTRNYEDHIVLAMHDPLVPNRVGRLAVDLVSRFGLIAGHPTGEDSAGRQSGELLPVDQVVKRAFDIAEAYFAELEARGHALIAPDAPPCKEERDAIKARAKEAATA